MKELIWDDSLSVQIKEIDDDHRRLIDLFNTLSRAIADTQTPDYIEAIIDELLSCTIWHFRHEERLMLKYNYANLVEHKLEHQELIESANELKQKFLQKGKTLPSEDIEYLEHWLTGHILGSDMEMAEVLCEVM